MRSSASLRAAACDEGAVPSCLSSTRLPPAGPLLVVERLGELVEARLPVAPKPGEPRIKLAEALRAKGVEAPYPFWPDLYEARVMKDAQMPRNPGLVNAHSGDNVVHRLLASLKGFDDKATRGVS